jgi:hypothetical protein
MPYPPPVEENPAYPQLCTITLTQNHSKILPKIDMASKRDSKVYSSVSQAWQPGRYGGIFLSWNSSSAEYILSRRKIAREMAASRLHLVETSIETMREY